MTFPSITMLLSAALIALVLAPAAQAENACTELIFVEAHPLGQNDAGLPEYWKIFNNSPMKIDLADFQLGLPGNTNSMPSSQFRDGLTELEPQGCALFVVSTPDHAAFTDAGWAGPLGQLKGLSMSDSKARTWVLEDAEGNKCTEVSYTTAQLSAMKADGGRASIQMTEYPDTWAVTSPDANSASNHYTALNTCTALPSFPNNGPAKPSAVPTGTAPRPSDKPAMPSAKPSEMPAKPSAKPSEMPAKPSAKPSEMPAKPSAKPSERPSKPSEMPAKPSAKPSEMPAKPSDKPARPSAKPSERPSKPSDKPARPSAKPSEKPAKPSEKPSKPSDKPARPSAKPSEKPAKPSVHPDVAKCVKVCAQAVKLLKTRVSCGDCKTGELTAARLQTMLARAVEAQKQLEVAAAARAATLKALAASLEAAKAQSNSTVAANTLATEKAEVKAKFVEKTDKASKAVTDAAGGVKNAALAAAVRKVEQAYQKWSALAKEAFGMATPRRSRRSLDTAAAELETAVDEMADVALEQELSTADAKLADDMLVATADAVGFTELTVKVYKADTVDAASTLAATANTEAATVAVDAAASVKEAEEVEKAAEAAESGSDGGNAASVAAVSSALVAGLALVALFA